MAAATPLTSSDAAAMDDRRLLELLLMMMVIHSLLSKEGATDDDGELKDLVRELSMSINGGGDQSAVSNQLLLAVTQRLLDEQQQLRLLENDGENEGRAVASSSTSDDHQLMDTAAAAKKKEKAAAAKKMKKKRNKRNKAAAKHKGTKRMSWLGGGGIISLIMIMMAAFGFITSLTHIPQSDGSSEGNKAPPTLPPSTSTSLRQRDLQSSDNMASASPSSLSPLAVVVQAPVFSPDTATVSNPPTSFPTDVSDFPTHFPTVTLSPTTSPKPSISPTKSAAPSSSPKPSISPTKSASPTELCFDTHNWTDKDGYGCKWYEEEDKKGCPQYGSLYEGDMGVANDHCCYCGGGGHTFSPTTSPTTSSSPTKSASPTELCFDTPDWKDIVGNGCKEYEKYDEPGCPQYGSLCEYEGDMGVANDNCCYCGGGSHTLPPTTSPKPSSSPTKSSSPSGSPKPSSSPTKSATPSSSSSPSSAPSMCTDTEGWYDKEGYDCSWYEVMDDPGCPQYGSQTAPFWLATAKGSANANCCYCQNAAVNTLSPTKAPSSSGTCVDTQGWKDELGRGCEHYQWEDPGCPEEGNYYVGAMGPASENCCYCKDPSCEDFNQKCQDRINWWDLPDPDSVKSVCDKAASSCCEAADHVKIVTNHFGGYDETLRPNETVGLYNECKCDFWLRLCEESREGEACNYAAEYCCGDYRYYEDSENFVYLNSPLCYCDFFNYAQNELGHTLKPKTLNISKEFSNPCRGQFEYWRSYTSREKVSLEAIYNETNGQNWTNNDGWMNETVEHCQWYGISCDVEGFVTSIDLRDNNLAGQFPVYARNEYNGDPVLHSHWMRSKYGVANIFKLKTLDLSDNKLIGTIEYAPLYNLHSLTHFDVSGNQFSGEVDALIAPSIVDANFSTNNFISARFEKYKVSPLQTLRYCDVSNNAIQEDANDLLENIPPNIEQFIASNNQIYRNLPESLNNLPNLRQFSMASNALSGKLPGFTESFATLQELDVFNQTNGLSGSIPENIWRSLSLKKLNLAGNRLTGTVPSLVGNLVVLEVFDLSNNLLDSSVPAELGMLEGSLKRLGLSNNSFSGVIPSQIGQLQGASVFLKGNHFYNSSTTAPLSLCLERVVKEFDLEHDTTLCPIERNALSDFHDSAKGPEWTDGSLWLDEYASCCDWKGVTCDNNTKQVTKLQLSNNGLSGRLSESIGKLTSIKVLDLSDNDIKGSIPAEIGLLSNLTYLRLSYNAFTGTAPEGLGELTKLQLLQLQSNRITEMPNMPQLNKDMHFKNSTFVTDCGVPSAFDEALECENCTMCCNANDDCYPQGETQVAKWGLKDYSTFAALVFGCFIVFCCIAALLLYEYDRRKNRGNNPIPSGEDDEYALSKIGKDSVYSYFVTDKVFGWVAAFATVGIQIGILVVFILASEHKLQVDTIDIQFTWKCPRDTDECKDKSDLTTYGWAIFCLLMAAFLAKDIISGSKLIYHSAKVRHSLGSRIRYFFGGMCLCSITLFAFYVSTVYNKAIATSNTEIILNSVIVLFIMDLDEWIFSDLEAINKKWTAHAEDDTTDKMKEQIASQQEEMESKIDEVKEEMNKEIELQKAQIATQQEELRMLRELVEKVLQSQAAAAAITATTTTASDSESVSEYEGDTNARQMEQSDEITMPCDGEQNIQEPQAAAAAIPNIERESDMVEDLQELVR